MLIINYTPQFSARTLEYDNDLKEHIVRVQIDGEVIEHDLSNYIEPKIVDGEPQADDLGFPFADFPKHDEKGNLHVTLIKWYR